MNQIEEIAREKTWDCPCHGSRFTATGELIAGPAESGSSQPETTNFEFYGKE